MRTGPNDARGAAVPPVVDEVLRSPGQALDPDGQIGVYGEGGGISLPGETGDRTYPYVGAGVTGGINIPLGRQKALQIFLDVGGRVGFDTQDSTQFGSFQSGLGVSLQLQ